MEAIQPLVLEGHVIDVLKSLPDESVQMCCTSPPFYGLRNYQTQPQVWGGDPECNHQWTRFVRKGTSGGTKSAKVQIKGEQNFQIISDSEQAICSECGAWRGELGSESSPELFVDHLVQIFREVKRVLRKDGTFWCNLGDSYWGGKGQSNYAYVKEHKDRKTLTRDYQNITGRGETRPQDGKHDTIKPKDLIEIPSILAQALRDDGWYLRARVPWIKPNCLSGGAVLYARTQKGDMPIMVRDLVRLDPATVKLWNGEKWTQVISWTPVKPGSERKKDSARIKYARLQDKSVVGNYVEIELRSGERIGCTNDHRWPTDRGVVYTKDLVIGDVIKHTNLPEANKPTPDGIPDWVGWVVGLYLAEGSRSNGELRFSLCTDEQGFIGRLQEFANHYRASLTKHVYGNNLIVSVCGRIAESIMATYIACDGAKHVHLTNACWMRSNTFLCNILDGYLMGDAHYEAVTGRWRLGFCQNDALASDLRTLCARLGTSLRLKRGSVTCQTGEFPTWRGQVRFNGTTKPVSNGRFTIQPDTEVVGIQQSRARMFYDIAVEDEPHLFCLASGVLTHNSMPESSEDRPTAAIEYFFMLTKSSSYFYDLDAIRVPQTTKLGGKFSQVFGGSNKYNGYGNATYSGKQWNPNPEGRFRRNSDWFTDSLDSHIDEQRVYLAHLEKIRSDGGLLLDEQGDPLALMVNTKGFSGAHFATFNPDLIEPLIKASTSEKGCCPNCGSPWKRIVERIVDGELEDRPYCDDGQLRSNGTRGGNGTQNSSLGQSDKVKRITTNWEPSCKCNAGEPTSCIVLDPFCGSGTTLLVSTKLGRRSIGIELNPEYAEMARQRCAQLGMSL